MSSFVPRFDTPSWTNKYFRRTGYWYNGVNGVNECIAIDTTTGYVLPNCVGQAWGRAYESWGVRPNLSRGNANTWWTYGDGYQRSSEPTLGAVMCFNTGEYGHVSFVEEKIDDTHWRTSNSAYGGVTYAIYDIYKVNGSWYCYSMGGLAAGFILPPVNFNDQLPIWLMKKIIDK